MKMESLVIVNQYVTVNDISNFAHTAHHARRVALFGNLTSVIKRFRFLGNDSFLRFRKLKLIAVGGSRPMWQFERS